MAKLMLVSIILIAVYLLVTTLILSTVIYFHDNEKRFKTSFITSFISTTVLLLIPIVLSNFLSFSYMFLKSYVFVAQPIISCLVYKQISKKPWQQAISIMVWVSVCQSVINLFSWLI